MARPWRLRHKLTLLLGLVLAAVGLLLLGTVAGLTVYRAAVDATEDKAGELQIVKRLGDAIHQAAAGDPAVKKQENESHLDFERRLAGKAVEAARDVLAGYRAALAANTARRGGGEVGRDEAELADKLLTTLAEFERAVEQAAAGSVAGDGDVKLLGPGSPAADAHARLKQLADDLHGFLIADMKKVADDARAAHARSLAAAGTAAGLALVLLLTLGYYFQVWVFAPVRQLQAGVRRVRAGDFDQPIRLLSDDELAELGDEFDAMTARMRDITADLRRQVTERTKQLVRSEKLVSVGFLAAGVAHEINNPLASIAFCAEALDDRLKELLSKAPAGEAEVVFKYLGMMQEEAQRCKQITHRLLDFARGGGKREPTDLAQIVRDVVSMTELTPTARDKAIHFNDPGPVTALVSGEEVKSVVLNMVVNALDSMDPGGRLDVRLRAAGGQAEFVFADTGCGMTADTLHDIFEPFFTRSKTGHGTGLGLSISHQIIDQHGGTVLASSPGPGRGSTFTVRLPLDGAAAPDTLPFPARAA